MILYNLSLVGAGNRNDFVGMKPDDRRLFAGVGERTGPEVRDGLMPANAIATRPIHVKMPYAPGAFTLSTPALQNTSLFRMDHTGNCTDTSGNPVDGLMSDILRLQWQPAVWSDPTYNNPNDTIRYEWYGIIDSIGTTSSKSLTVSVLADNDGKSPSLTLSGDKVRELLFRPNMLPQVNQPDSLVMRVMWYVRAFSKMEGLETFSDTAGVTVRNNPLPTEPLIISINRLPDTPPQAVQPPDGGTEFVDGTAPLDVLWSAASDINNRKGELLAGGAAPGPFMIYNPTTRMWELDPARTIDTLSYQWVGSVVSTFPVGKGAALGSMLVINAGASTGIQVPTSDLDQLFATFSADPTSTSADSVKMEWFVYTKDFNVTDGRPLEQVEFPFVPGFHVNPDSTALNGDTSRWSPTSCQPHWIVSGPFRLNLTKLKGGGVEISPMAGDPDINALVGEELCFTLTAKDENGNIIRDWDSPSKNNPATILKLDGSTANTDTSQGSWNADPNGYSYALITKDGTELTPIPPDEWSIPASEFKDGIVVVCIVHTKAESGVTIEVNPTVANLNQTSATMNFTADAITNYLVDLTSATGNPNEVYLLRRYEIVVSPRDRFLNIVDDRTIRTDFTARFPGEFDQNQVGLSDIFAGSVFIKGTTNYFLASRITRIIANNNEPQWVRAYSSADNMVLGQTNPYQILDHAPNDFALQTPADNTELRLMRAADVEQFTWVMASPQDPYTNIQISRFDPATFTDEVSYTIRYLDAASLTRAVEFESDNNGKAATFTSNHGQLAGLIDDISGNPTTLEQEVVWFVKATDGLYVTESTPPKNDTRDGYKLKLIKDGILSVEGPAPANFSLSQNYPNPFNPTTTISYALPKSTQVTMVVYDLLGNMVKTLVNESMDAGTYVMTWDATNNAGVQVPSGNYILKMVAGNFTQTRKMTLLK